jgi:hypothetical protein
MNLQYSNVAFLNFARARVGRARPWSRDPRPA